MSEDPTPYDVVRSKILQLATAPFFPQEHTAWQASVDAAYRELSHTRAFRKVLEHWTVTVLLNAEADAGARGLVIEVLRSMHALNTRQYAPREDEEERHGW